MAHSASWEPGSGGRQSSFAFCACRASWAISSAVRPLVVRRSAASSTGWRLMMSVMSVETRPARASRSSVSHPMIPAIARTLSSAGGRNSSRSTLDRYVGLTPIILAILRNPIFLPSRSRRMNAPNFFLAPVIVHLSRSMFSCQYTVDSRRASIIR